MRRVTSRRTPLQQEHGRSLPFCLLAIHPIPHLAYLTLPAKKPSLLPVSLT